MRGDEHPQTELTSRGRWRNIESHTQPEVPALLVALLDHGGSRLNEAESRKLDRGITGVYSARVVVGDLYRKGEMSLPCRRRRTRGPPQLDLYRLITIGDVLVDPYAVAPTTVEKCRQWLAENKVAEEGAFDLTRPNDIVLRMRNNARILIQNAGDFVRALDISDYQLLVVPDYYGLYVERADAWLGLNAPEMVVEELEKAAERAPDARTADRLHERTCYSLEDGEWRVSLLNP